MRFPLASLFLTLLAVLVLSGGAPSVAADSEAAAEAAAPADAPEGEPEEEAAPEEEIPPLVAEADALYLPPEERVKIW